MTTNATAATIGAVVVPPFLARFENCQPMGNSDAKQKRLTIGIFSTPNDPAIATS